MARLLPVLVIWIIALMAVAATRYRIQWDTYVALHQWLAERGVPAEVRRFDHVLIFAFAAFLGAWLSTAGQGGSLLNRLRLQKGVRGWLIMQPWSLAPMVVGGALLGWSRGAFAVEAAEAWSRILRGVIRAPIAEELLFRGLLIGVVAALIGWRGIAFWINAMAAAMLFASIHVDWTVDAVLGGWPTLLVTGAGGLWYAWLLARWQTLWVPMGLHAGMNLGWMLAAAGGGAGGGGWMENVLRVVTIAVATWWTVRRRGEGAEVRGGTSGA